MGLGFAYTLAFASGGEADALLRALAVAGLGLPLLLILLDESENAFAAYHSAAVATGFLAQVKIWQLTLAIGILCTLLALLVPLAQYEHFLLLIGSVFAPLFGVVLVDHFLLRRRKAPQRTQALRLESLIAWALGVAVYHLLPTLLPAWGATLPAIVVAGTAQALLGLKRV
jgi:NCS1 family nucleobase:cation symporter-1